MIETKHPHSIVQLAEKYSFNEEEINLLYQNPALLRAVQMNRVNHIINDENRDSIERNLCKKLKKDN